MKTTKKRKRIWKKRMNDTSREKRKNVRQSFLSLCLLFSSLPFSLSFAFVLIIDHHLLFLFDQTISSWRRRRRKKWKIIQQRRLSKSSSDSCGTRDIAVVGLEITTQLMNSIAAKYIQNGEKRERERKNARTHVVYLTNVCSKYKQTK